MSEPRRVRAIFLSDVHLGSRDCQADRLLALLRHHESEYLYLLGDIVDFRAMRRTVHWSAAQNTVVQKILKRARRGVRVLLVPGNHDVGLRHYVGLSFGDIRVLESTVHDTVDGRRLLLLHGDRFDADVRFHRWLTVLGDHGYALLMCINRGLALVRRRCGYDGHWSLAAAVKRRLAQAQAFIASYEEAAARHAADSGFDGIVCGHIDAAAKKRIAEVDYLNCGDWVDSCTALVEHFDGRFELLAWDQLADVLQETPASTARQTRAFTRMAG